MKNPSQEDLLGFVLGALDADQQTEVQQLVDQDPQLEEQLLDIKSSMAPLELLDEVPSGRPGLARRTCEMLAAIQKEEQLRKQSVEPALTMDSPAPEEVPNPLAAPGLTMAQTNSYLGRSSWSLNDVLVLAASLAVLAALLFPAISYSRYHADRTACQSNFSSLGQAFLSYSEIHDGTFMEIPMNGNLAVAGSFAPILKDAGLIEDDSVFACAGANRKTPVRIPTCEQIENSSGDYLGYLHRTMSGDYGYSLGYVVGEQYKVPQQGGGNLIIAADQPSPNLEGHRSANHRGVGQNCLFEDGHVEYVAGHAFGDDPIYKNDYDLVAPGANSGDCVIGASFHSPRHFQLSPQ